MNEEASYYYDATPPVNNNKKRVVDFDRKCHSKQHLFILMNELYIDGYGRWPSNPLDWKHSTTCSGPFKHFNIKFHGGAT